MFLKILSDSEHVVQHRGVNISRTGTTRSTLMGLRLALEHKLFCTLMRDHYVHHFIKNLKIKNTY